MSVFTNPASGAAEHAAAYVSAILELLGDRDPIAVLREMPSALPRAIDGAVAAAAAATGTAGEVVDRSDSAASRGFGGRLGLAHAPDPCARSTAADRVRPGLMGRAAALRTGRSVGRTRALCGTSARESAADGGRVPSRPQKGRRACRARGGEPGAPSPALRGARFAAPSADRSCPQRACLTRVGLVPR